MVLPLIGFGVVILAGGSAITMLKTGFFQEKWKKLNGQTIAILGTRASGKTRFFEFIATGKLNKTDKHEQTKTKEDIHKKFGIKRKTLKHHNTKITFNLANSVDVAGGDIAYQDWKHAVSQSHFLIYIIDVARLMNDDTCDDYKATIKKDIAQIDNLARQDNIQKSAIVASHCDKLPLYRQDPDTLYQNITKIGLIMEIQLALGGTQKCIVAMGCLENEEEANHLLTQVINHFN